MNVILHIAYRAQWLRGQAEGVYRADSLATQGFIHTSRPHQLLGVANVPISETTRSGPFVH